MEIQYIGEHLVFGQLGNALIILSFVAALLSTASWWISIKSDEFERNAWVKLAKTSFWIHAVSVIGIIVLIYFLIHGRYFEYYYVWQHSNSILPIRYMWACLWEGQEGSFLVWTFWHLVVSFFILYRKDSWQAPVMGVIMVIQAFLASMLLGLELGTIKIGSNPFILLRNHPDFANLPFIRMPDYLSKIQDGRGLNPLLQNYWMVIHPPTLFLGFAATAVPFAYAIAGLATKRIREWITPALPWTLAGIAILGTGILMGGAWAYESLSFGGFWAWDPVENASLVPWLTLVAANHVMIIQRKNGTALGSSIILVVTTFLLVLYSTFLTRSGILGDTSVHAFTDLGMKGQLILYMLFFVVWSIALMIKHRNELRGNQDDDAISSREFWMFIGTLVLVVSAIQITVTTSLPVINKVFGTKLAPPEDAVDFYNSWQVPLAFIIASLMAVGQYFRWKSSEAKTVLKRLSLSFVISLILTSAYQWGFGFNRIQHVLLLFSSIWACTANADYLIRALKGKLSVGGASVAHVGMALVLLGALVSNGAKQVISQNRLRVDLGKDFPNNENILLYQRDTLPMGEYYVTYKGRTQEDIHIRFEVEYYKQNPENGQLEKDFSLFPFVQLNKQMGNVSEPSTRHYFNRDIYTHVTYAEMEDASAKSDQNGYKEGKAFELKPGDTITTSNSLIVLEGLSRNVDRNKYMIAEGDLAVSAQLLVMDVNRKLFRAEPVFILRDSTYFNRPDEIEDLGLKFTFEKVLPEENKVKILIAEKEGNSRDFIIMKAIIFPHINLLWIGCILLGVGTWMAVVRRLRETRNTF